MVPQYGTRRAGLAYVSRDVVSTSKMRMIGMDNAPSENWRAEPQRHMRFHLAKRPPAHRSRKPSGAWPRDHDIGNFLAVWKLQYRCLGLSSCELAACRLVQSRQPATGIIVIDIPAVLDCADTINNLPGLIKFKRYLGQAVEIAVWIGAHHEHNLWFGEPYFSRRFHRKCSLASFSGTSLIQGSHASL